MPSFAVLFEVAELGSPVSSSESCYTCGLTSMPDTLESRVSQSLISGQRSARNPVHKLVEAPDVYDFLHASAAPAWAVDHPSARRPDTFEVFWDTRFLGNARIAPCSKILKQIPCRRWLEANADPSTTVLYVGIDAAESRRIPGIRAGWAPWPVEFPFAEDEPDLTKDAMLDEARTLGLTPPAAYAKGYAHANCSGLCVRGGQAHWRRTLLLHPELFADYEQRERQFRPTTSPCWSCPARS